MTIDQPISQAIPWACAPGPKTYETLVAPHMRPLGRWVRSRVPPGEDADDIIQQTLLLALKNIGQFRNEASLTTWLCRIAVNVIRGRMRRPDRWRTVFTDPQHLAASNVTDPLQSPEAALVTKEANLRLHRAISSLPELYRVVVELRDLRGLSIQETADSLRLSKPAVKSRHNRARCMLSKLYAAA